MRSLLTPLTLAIASTCVYSVSAQSAILLNGQPIDSLSITTNASNDVLVTTTGGPTDMTDMTDMTDGTDMTDMTDSTDMTDMTDNTDIVDPTCGALDDDVTLTAPIANWASPGGSVRLDLNNTGIISTEFTTTSGTGFFGKITAASTTGNSLIGRRVWVSNCPGGDPLPQPRCERTGNSVTSLSWTQGAPSGSKCNINTNTRYYMNFENLNCTNNQCDIERTIYKYGSPN